MTFLITLWVLGSLGVIAALFVGVANVMGRAPAAEGVERPQRRWYSTARAWLWVSFAVATVGLIGTLTTAGDDDNVQARDDSSVTSVSKYTQTWPQSYGETSCTEWNSQLTVAQQFAAAADMLTSARNKMDGGEGLPEDLLIDQFGDAISTACVVDTASITEIAVGVYLTEPVFAP